MNRCRGLSAFCSDQMKGSPEEGFRRAFRCEKHRRQKAFSRQEPALVPAAYSVGVIAIYRRNTLAK